jgi:hypothetical protein
MSNARVRQLQKLILAPFGRWLRTSNRQHPHQPINLHLDRRKAVEDMREALAAI